MEDFPHGHAALVMALDEYLEAPEIVVIRGSQDDAENWSREVSAVYAPRRLVFAIPVDAPNLPEALATKAAGDNTLAYICQGMTCSAPVESLKELAAGLSEA